MFLTFVSIYGCPHQKVKHCPLGRVDISSCKLGMVVSTKKRDGEPQTLLFFH